MDAARAAEAAKAPHPDFNLGAAQAEVVTAALKTALIPDPPAPPMETPTTASFGGPPEIPAVFLDKLPAWE
jgi:hypothetical protein